MRKRERAKWKEKRGKGKVERRHRRSWAVIVGKALKCMKSNRFLCATEGDFAWDYMYICMWLNTTLRVVKRLNKIVHGRENAARREKLHYRYQTLARICCRGIFVPSLYQGRTRAVPAPCQGRSSITRIEAEKRGLGWWVEVVKIRDKEERKVSAIWFIKKNAGAACKLHPRSV